jgi:putative flippase GtrA
MMWQIAQIALLVVISYIQNVAFTFASRSRNSGDPSYHRKCAYFSNGVWYVGQLLMTGQMFAAYRDGDFFLAAVIGVLYTLATSEGSVRGMHMAFKTESGAKKVGSYEAVEAVNS